MRFHGRRALTYHGALLFLLEALHIPRSITISSSLPQAGHRASRCAPLPGAAKQRDIPTTEVTEGSTYFISDSRKNIWQNHDFAVTIFLYLRFTFSDVVSDHRRSDKGLKTILPLAGKAVWVTFLLELSPPLPPFLNPFFTNSVAAWHKYMNRRTTCLKFSRLSSCNYFNLSNLSRKTWKKLISVMILVFFSISLEILVALTLKTVENRSIFIIIVHNFNWHTDQYIASSIRSTMSKFITCNTRDDWVIPILHCELRRHYPCEHCANIKSISWHERDWLQNLTQ